MYTYEEIDQFLKETGFSPRGEKKALKDLPNILNENEKLLGVIDGWLKQIHNRKIDGTGLIIVTDKRILFYRKSIIGTVTKEEIPTSKISSVSFRKGLLSSSLIITSSNNEAIIEQCEKAQAQKLSDLISGLIA